MFGWISRMYGSVAGRIDNTVRRWVRDFINGLYGFLHVIFSAVASEWVGLWQRTQDFANTFFFFCHSVWVKLYGLVRVVIPRIVSEYRRLIHDLTTYAAGVYHALIAGLAHLEQLARRLIDDAINWVIVNVYRPLARLLTSAWHWITHEGDTIWQYITHPDKLAELISGSLIALLEREAWTVADKLGRFALSLVFRNLRRFVALAEDILDAIL